MIERNGNIVGFAMESDGYRDEVFVSHDGRTTTYRKPRFISAARRPSFVVTRDENGKVSISGGLS